MRLTFEPFDRRYLGVLDVIDQDTGKEVGYIIVNGVGFVGGGGIEVSLFDGKYQTSAHRYEEVRGFINGVEAVLNHMTRIQSPQVQAKPANVA